MRVEFIKKYRDNPKVNAIILSKARLSDWPQLQPLPDLEEADDIRDQSEAEESTHSNSQQRDTASGPKPRNPYENDESYGMLPIFLALGAFIPLMFCMRKL